MNLSDGSTTTLRIEEVDAAGMKTMAALLQDPNPIHFDPAVVRALGMGDRVVNQGPTNMGWVIDLLREADPDAVLSRLTVRFTANVLAGDTALASANVTAREQDGGDVRLGLEVALDVEGGARALAGTAELRFRAGEGTPSGAHEGSQP